MLALLLAAAVYGDAAVAFSFTDERIAESSGLAASSTADGVVFTHNDSGDEARFFAVDASGRTVTTYVLPDVQARDWEDMARGPDEAGRSSLWLGDIGDNNAARDRGILVHRVPEPVPGEADEVTTPAPTSFRLRYPDGPGDAEGLAVSPTGRLYVVGKPLAGPARVYAAPQPLDPDGPNLLEEIGSVPVRATGTDGGPSIGGLAQLLVTGADLSPDGSRFAVRTYTDVYEYAVPGGDLAAALEGEPVVSPLPETDQGEAIAYSRDGRSLLTSSEGSGAPVHRLTAQPVPASEPSSAASDGSPGGPSTAPSGAPSTAPSAAGRRGPWVVAAVAVLLSAAVVLARRRRRPAP